MKRNSLFALAVLMLALLALALLVAACGGGDTTSTQAVTTATQATTTSTHATTTTTEVATTTTAVSQTTTTFAAVLPPAQFWHSMVYDPVSARVLLFGGVDDVFNPSTGGVTWTYDPAANTWTELAVPWPTRTVLDAPAAHDPASGKIILFGGLMARSPFSDRADTWAYDPSANTWANLKLSQPIPSGRSGHSMVYDPSSGKMILLGGEGERLQLLGDTWAYDPAANTWTELHPTASAP